MADWEVSLSSWEGFFLKKYCTTLCGKRGIIIRSKAFVISSDSIKAIHRAALLPKTAANEELPSIVSKPWVIVVDNPQIAKHEIA